MIEKEDVESGGEREGKLVRGGNKRRKRYGGEGEEGGKGVL